MEDSVKSRLIKYLDEKGISKAEFGRRIGVSGAYVTSMRKSIQPEKLKLIADFFPDLNRDWLLYGEGDMLKKIESNAKLLGYAHKAIAEDTISVRFYEVTPSATFQEFCAGESQIPTTINIIPPKGELLDDSFCVFQISGESMAPQIQPGARVLCKEVPPTRWHTIFDGVVVIAYADRFVIKRIAENRLQSENYIVIASDNPAFPTRETVQLSDIRAIFKAKRIISSEII